MIESLCYSMAIGARILVNGAGGFIGAHVVDHAVRIGAKVYGIERPGRVKAGKRLLHSLHADGIELLELDMSDAGRLTSVLKDIRPDCIVHAVGELGRTESVPPWHVCVSGNVQTIAAIAQAVSAAGNGWKPAVVLPGSQLEYGQARTPWNERSECLPVHPYATSKLSGTDLLRGATRTGIVRGAVCRLPVVYGPGQSPAMMIPEAIVKAMKGEPVELRTPRARRQIVFARDVAELLVGLGLRIANGEQLPDLLNMPSSEPMSVLEIIDRISAAMNTELKTRSLPSDQAGSVPEHTMLDDSLARELGFENSYTVDSGLDETVRWYRSNGWFWEGA